MKRYLEKYILKDLKKKIVLLSGPRQTGKTTLSKMLMTGYDYFNYDSSEDRLGLLEKSWDRSKDLIIFDELHNVVFRVSPFHKNITRSILKTPKFYFYDTGQVVGDSGAKLENLFACTLQKEIHFLEDCYGKEKYLYYLKNKDGKEIDFCIAGNQNPELLVEVKLSDENISPNFNIFQKYFPKVKMIQIVKNLKREKTFPNGVEVRSAGR